MQFAAELGDVTPLWEAVGQRYVPTKERIQAQNYRIDLEAKRLKGSPRITHFKASPPSTRVRSNKATRLSGEHAILASINRISCH